MAPASPKGRHFIRVVALDLSHFPDVQACKRQRQIARSLTLHYPKDFSAPYDASISSKSAAYFTFQLLCAVSSPVSYLPMNNTYKSAKVISPRILAFSSNSISRFNSILSRNPSCFFVSSLGTFFSALPFCCWGALGRWGRDCC